MARRYSRDNRGRFASGGTGATARGGRLKTASGNKRATQTTKAAAAKPSGTVAGKVKRNPAAAGKIGKQAKAVAPKAAKRKAIGAISEAKAGRIISRIDANRPGLRKATGSARKTQNSIRTQGKATDFALAAGARARKQGKSLSVNESLQRGVKNAAKRSQAAKPAAPKAAKPVQTKLGTRLNPAKKADRKATKSYDTAYNRENRIRTSLFKGNKSSEKKQAIIKELNKASNTTATMLMQRRGIRGSFPVQSKDKVFRAAAGRTSGTISKNKDVRNATNRKEAFKRRVTRAGSLSSTGANKKGRQTARTRAKALATYQGSRRPERSDSTVGGIRGARTSPSFKAPATRLGTPSRAARQQGKALSLAQTRLRDSTNRLIGNPKKVQRKRKTGQRALDFYKNPKATTEKVLKQRGNAGLSTAGFRKPRNMR